MEPSRQHLSIESAASGTANTPLVVFPTTVNGSHDSHDHEFMEIVLITGGEGVHISQAGRIVLKAGDVIIMRAGAWHAYSKCQNLGVYNCCLGLQLFNRELAFASHHPILNYLFWVGPLSPENRGVLKLHLDADRRDECILALDALAESCATSGNPCAILESLGRLMLVFTIIARQVHPVHTDDMQQVSAHTAVVQCRRLLEDACDREWTLRDLADRVHLAPAYLVRIFKKGTGLSPIAFLNRCRAERAAMLLLRTSKPITQIAAEVGWPDASYFARCFKKCFDMTASDYRNRFSAQPNPHDLRS